MPLNIPDFNLFFMWKLQPPEKGNPFPSFFIYLLFDKKYFIYQLSFALIMHSQNKTNFFFQLIAGWFCVYVFRRVLFHISAVIKLLIASCLYIICFIFILVSWNNHVENYRLLLFSVSEEANFEIDTNSIIVSYLYHFRNVNKELYRYC